MCIKYAAVLHTYNNAQYISDAIDGALQQTVPPAEIIVLDDGSTDDTERIVRNRYRERVKYSRVVNSGCGAARRQAIEMSTQPWIAQCDSDDVWFADHISRKCEALRIHGDIDYFCSNFCSFGPNAGSGYTRLGEAPNGWLSRYATNASNEFAILDKPYLALLEFNPAFPSGVVMKRDLYDRVGGIRDKYSRCHAEDTDFTRRAMLDPHAVVACDLKVTWKYRRTGKNMSTTNYKNSLWRGRIINDLIADGLVPEEFRAASLRRVSESFTEAFRLAFWDGHYRDAVDIYKSINTKLGPKDKLRYMMAFAYKFLK